MKCPKCLNKIDPKKRNNLNVVKCSSCSGSFKLRPKKALKQKAKVDIPQGAWLNKTQGGIEVGISTKNAQSRISVVLAIISTISSLAVFIYFELYLEVGFYAIVQDLWIFVIVAAFWVNAIVANYGQIVFTIDRVGGKMFLGYKEIGITKKFLWSQINSVEEFAVKRGDLVSMLQPPAYTLKLVGFHQQVSCKMALEDNRRKFLHRTLDRILKQVKPSNPK